MFISNKIKLNNIISFPKEIGEWLVLNKIPILSFSENGDYMFANTKNLKEQLKLLPDKLKGGAKC